MPVYLRFVKGVIDSADLPLNVSPRTAAGKPRRQGDPRRLDQARAVDARRRWPTARTPPRRTKYAAFWKDFGAVLKEGVGEDHANQERLAKLLRFASTQADEGVSFADYVGRMKEGQEAIYYITADSLAAAKNSPQLEIFRKKGIEVLLLIDRVDEWMLSHLYEFDGKPLQSVAKGAVDLGKLQDEAEKKQAEEAADSLQADARPAEGGAEGPRQGRARHDAAGRFAGLPGGRGGRHERPPGAPAEAGRPERAEVAADPRGQCRASAGRSGSTASAALRRPRRTSCSTRRCSPRAASSRIPAAYVRRVNALLLA